VAAAVWRDGSGRGAGDESAAGRERAAQAGRGGPGGEGADIAGGELKKMASPSARRRAVQPVCEENLGSITQLPRREGAVVNAKCVQRVRRIRPGSPWENGYIESFHDKLRDECLNREIFGRLVEARVVIGQWMEEYNEQRPHSSLAMPDVPWNLMVGMRNLLIHDYDDVDPKRVWTDSQNDLPPLIARL